MNEYFKNVIYKLCISLVLLISLSSYNTSYALSVEDKVDILIQNQEKRKNLNEKIKELDNILESKNKELDNVKDYIDNEGNEKIEVITISFVPKEEEYDESEKITSEIITLEQNKSVLEEELQDNIIEGVKLEKSIEEEVSMQLKEEGSEFIEGIWPLNDYKDISSGFGYRIHPITQIKSFHKGIDIPAPQDTDVLATDSGVVIFSGYQNGYGNVVKIKHFDGKITVYAHNNSNVVSKGDIVKQGQVISKVGTTGNSTGNHVHFEIIVNDENINPIKGIIR